MRTPPLGNYQTDQSVQAKSNFEEKSGIQAKVKVLESVDQTKQVSTAQREGEEQDDNVDDGDADNGENKSPIGMNSFMDFLKSAQNTLLQYKMNTYRSKMSVLKHLRDVLTLNINEKIANFKLSDGNNQARTYKEDEHQMDYSSNEGALMTIGFLTFSVFLIKLVIKLVHLLKYKHQYYGLNTITTTTPATVVFLKRHGRIEDEHDITRILEYTENLKN
ncbi:unnamed protein product [Callosobruchus maculatus]|nr:unnamed protein product [Callosobruchus maculatus]